MIAMYHADIETSLETLFANWQKHGAVAIEELRQKAPETYLRIIAHLVGRPWPA